MLRTLAVLYFGAVLHAAPPPTLAAKIRALIEHSPTAADGYWGIEIADAATGATIYRSNSDKFFVPASNTKLFTTAMTLTRLGSRARIQTTINAAQPPDPDGVLGCDLVLVGAGDPSLTGTDLEAMADRLVERGLRRINGSIVGDDTAFDWEPYSPGWSIDDAVEGYGAPTSALTVNDNIVMLHVTPSGVRLDPAVPLLTIENRIQEDDSAPVRIHYERLPGSNVLRLWGSLRKSTEERTIELGVDDPARYAAMILADALRRKGVQIAGKAEARHRLAGANAQPQAATIELARHDSLPLLEDLRVTDKSSQNMHAETYLRLVGRGSRTTGLDELHKFLNEAGIDQKKYSLRDGSGMSRLNVVTPHAVVELLLYMAKSTNYEDWTTMLAVGGIDGTLENRMKSKKLKGRIFAKTGSLTHVTALSGYAERRNGRRYVFSMIANNYNGPAADIRDVMDKICSLLVD
jgi:D-alanyl-D-alanine carboxypeptidase/D-alanyl-D-alanine-endopeptidase (penicillin-binding protein 4)